jgi:aspartyl protease family protein
MLRNMILLGTAVGVAVAFPMIYESRQDAIHDGLASRPAETRQERAPPVQLSLAQDRPTERQTESLAGRVVRLQGDRQGHFVGEFRFNGQRMDALIDTGATYVAMNRSTARRIGIDLQPDDFRHTVNTANGRTRAAAAVIGRLELGRIHVENVEALVLDDQALEGILIGMNFLNRLRRYSVEGGTLIMEQ